MPNPTDRDYWEVVRQESILKAMEAVKEAAKQLIAVTTTLQGLYFVALSVGDVKRSVTDWRIVVFALPVLSWLICLGLSVRVFVPEDFDVSGLADLAKVYRQALGRQSLRLRRAQYMLVLGMGFLLTNVLAYLLWIPSQTSTSESAANVTMTSPSLVGRSASTTPTSGK